MKWGDLGDCVLCKNQKWCHICPGISLQENDELYSHTKFMCDIAKSKKHIMI